MAYGNGSDVMGGAMGGASLGMMVGGPVGAGIGGVAGGLGGYLFGGDGKPKYTPDRNNFNLPGYDGMNSQYGQLLGQGPRQAPQAGQSGFRGGQMQLGSMLMGQARGNGPGQEIARQQAQQQTDRGLGQQLAGARSARPGQSAMAARNAAMASGQLQGQGAQAATMGGLMAQQSAIGQAGQVFGQARGQDDQLAMGNARLQHDTMGLDDARQLDLLRQRLLMNQQQQQGGFNYESALGGKFDTQSGQPSSMERMMGGMQGLGQAYLGYKAGQQPSGQQQGGAGQSYSYSPPPLQTGQQGGYGFGQYGGFGGNFMGTPGQLGTSTPVSPYGSGVTGAQTGYQLPKL